MQDAIANESFPSRTASTTMSTPVASGRREGGNSPVAFATETALTKIKAQQQHHQQQHRTYNAPSLILPFRLSTVTTNDDYTDNDNGNVDDNQEMEMNPQPVPNATKGVSDDTGAKEHVDDHLDDMIFKSLSNDDLVTGDSSEMWSKTTQRSCLTSFLYDSVWPGLGLLGESYMLFSIGILRPIWDIVFPDCFVKQNSCTETMIHSLTYSIIFGVILGMICIGYASNSLGRRRGSITTASLMCIGSWSLTLLSYLASKPEFSDSISSLFWCISISFFVFGVGVGGEYPLSASSASEKAIEDLHARVALEKGEKKKAGIKSRISNLLRDDTHPSFTTASTKNDREAHHVSGPSEVQKSHRGRRVQLVFSMQGVGIFLNCLVITGLLALLGKPDENNEYNPVALLFVWQVSYCIGSLILSFVLISRIMLLTESKVWINVKRERWIAEELKRIQIQEQIMQSPRNNLHQAVRAVVSPQTISSKKNKVNDNSKRFTPIQTGFYTPPDPPGRTNNSYQQIQKDDVNDNNQINPFLPNNYLNRPNGGNTSEEDDDCSFSDTISSMTLPTLVQNEFTQPELDSALPDRELVKGHDTGFAAKQKTSNKDLEYLGPDGVPEDGDQSRRLSPQSQKHQPISKYFAHKLQQQKLEKGEKQGHDDRSSYDAPSLHSATGFTLLLQQYGMRLVGVSVAWMLWDVAFYGNKLFQSAFLLALTGDETSLIEMSIAATINAAVALLGYFAAAWIIDSPYVGRTPLQHWGFLVVAILFVSVGYFFDQMKSQILIALYLGTSFVGQLGPNATTFLIPVEVFPTEMRTYCHGIAAAFGKVGALIASVAFHHISTDADLFLISGYASFIACVITVLLIPDTTGLDLYEYDKKWKSFIWGQPKYVGEADSPKFLSFYERHYNTLVRWFCCCCCCSCDSTMPLPDDDMTPDCENMPIESNYHSFPDKEVAQDAL
jgi:MFS family permease